MTISADSRDVGLDEKWPCPNIGFVEEPHFLFIMAPPFSGSTALAHVLATAHGAALLSTKGEGQWLVPGMCESDRWQPAKQVNWRSVRAIWLQHIQDIRRRGSRVSLIIEKSPPNIVRADGLTRTFPNHSLLAFNRNPYANCASLLYRQYEPEGKHAGERSSIVSQLAGGWLVRSRHIKKAIDKYQMPRLSYEQFCSDPAACVATLVGDMPVLKTVDVAQEISVKDYPKQELRDFNAEQIAKLNQQEINAITETLANNAGLVNYFGYELLT